MTRANIPHFGRPFGTDLKENEMRALFQTQGNFQAVSAEWPLLIQNTGTGGLRLRIDSSAFDRPAAVTTTTGGIIGATFRIKFAGRSDYLRCRTWNGVVEGSTDVNVAKPWFLRGSETWEGVVRRNVAYSAYRNIQQQRTASRGNVTEVQKVVPFYDIDDVIVAVKSATDVIAGVGDDAVPVVWADTNADGRMWMVTIT